MRFCRLAHDFLSSPAKVALLSALLRHPRARFTGRHWARLSGLSPMAAWRTLCVLQGHGLVGRERVGTSDAWQLNARHFLAERLGVVADLDASAHQSLFELLKRHFSRTDALAVYLFGSVAEGRERPESDIDVMVVARLKKSKPRLLMAANEAVLDVLACFGNHLSVQVLSKAEWNAGSALVREVREKGIAVFRE